MNLLSLFCLPKGVNSKLEKIQRDFSFFFFFGGGGGCGGVGNLDGKIHLINWGIVCSSKEKGGLWICIVVKGTPRACLKSRQHLISSIFRFSFFSFFFFFSVFFFFFSIFFVVRLCRDALGLFFVTEIKTTSF